MAAAKPDDALSLYLHFNELLKQKGIHVETGEFGAMMNVSLNNDGPVTLFWKVKKESGPNFWSALFPSY